MKVDSLIEILSACHLSAFVESIHKERGGIMLIGPPASLKTAVTEVLDLYPANQLLSDLTVKQAVRLRDDISGGKITTLAFTDFAKLYQRQSSGASNIEGFLRAVTAEGFRRANWEDSRIAVIPARCMVVASMTQHFYTKHYADWIDDGFARRFLRCVFRLSNPGVIIEAIEKNIRLEFGSNNGFNPKVPTCLIHDTTTETEAKQLSYLLRNQECKEIGLVMLRKCLSALKWKFPNEKTKAQKIIKDFSESLTKEGAVLEM